MVSRDKWLGHGLTAIEVNSTFYRLPSEAFVASLTELPASVSIVVKLWRYITHMKFLKDIEPEWKEFVESLRRARNRIDAVLVQMPPRFHYNSTNMERLVNLKRLADGSGLKIAVEVRDKSWLNNAAFAKLKKHSIVLVGTVIKRTKPDQKWLGTMPTGTFIPPLTGQFSYTRFHGSKGFRGLYTKRELETIKRDIVGLSARNNYVFFNNAFFDYKEGPKTCPVVKTRAAALCDAVMFESMVARN